MLPASARHMQQRRLWRPPLPPRSTARPTLWRKMTMKPTTEASEAKKGTPPGCRKREAARSTSRYSSSVWAMASRPKGSVRTTALPQACVPEEMDGNHGSSAGGGGVQGCKGMHGRGGGGAGSITQTLMQDDMPLC